MKTTLEFNLPEDEVEFQFAIYGKIYWESLYNIKSEIRNILKYGTKKSIDGVLEDLDNLIPYQVDDIPQEEQ